LRNTANRNSEARREKGKRPLAGESNPRKKKGIKMWGRKKGKGRHQRRTSPTQSKQKGIWKRSHKKKEKSGDG